MGSKQSSRILPSVDYNKFILMIIDVQNDFCKGGTLAVPDADLIIAPINKLRYTYDKLMHTVVTQDYHPDNHMSFCTTHGKPAFEKVNLILNVDKTTLNIDQTLWPKHCVRGTNGADFHPDLIVTKKDTYIKKGKLENIESYSAFGDSFKNKYENTGLHKTLETAMVTDIVLTGIATDYCVYHTALDAIRYGYKVHLILSCTKGVAKESTEDAIEKMYNKGVSIYENVDTFYDYYKNVHLSKK